MKDFADFENRNPELGKKGTIVDANYYNSVKKELLNVIKNKGLTPSDKENDQLDKAINKAIRESSIVMSEAESQAIRKQNEEKYAASGFIHHGKNTTGVASKHITVNEGISSAVAKGLPNQITLGTPAAWTDRYNGGNSKTDRALANIAGITTDLYYTGTYLTDPNLAYTCIKFPEAPDGTVIYDSSRDCRGTGKSNLDLLNEVDPKYGNVASSLNEATARAFEGVIKNGDFRLGNNGDWYDISDDDITPEGTLKCVASESKGRKQSIVWDEDKYYELEVHCSSYTSGRVSIYVYGVDAKDDAILSINSEGTHRKIFRVSDLTNDQSSDNIINIYTPSASDLEISHISVRPVTEEVVTQRVDMAGFEYWLEEIKDDEVFPFTIQNPSSTFGDTDVPTVESQRPLSYFQVFDGQSDIHKGKCVLWSQLTEEQRRKVANYLGESFFVGENGYLVQLRVRQRTTAGLGNGDWQCVDSNTSEYNVLEYAQSEYLPVQGNSDTFVPEFISSWWNNNNGNFVTVDLATKKHINVTDTKGIFVGGKSDNPVSVAYKGECYFQVICTVPRLNKGAYHPSFNPFGSSLFRYMDDSYGKGGAPWWRSDRIGRIKSIRECFHFVEHDTSINQPAALLDYGFISSKASGRPDDKYYDIIYGSGLGGVVDHRPKYGAWDASSPQQASEVLQEVKSGRYRGREKLRSTVPLVNYGDRPLWFNSLNGNPKFTVGSRLHVYGNKRPEKTHRTTLDVSECEIGDVFYIFINGEYCQGKIYGFRIRNGIRAGAYSHITYISTNFSDQLINTDERYYKPKSQALVSGLHSTNVTVEGEFLHNDVIGSPDEIQNNPDLVNGWLGSWIPTIPDGSEQEFKLTRKLMNGLSRRYDEDASGLTWKYDDLSYIGKYKNSAISGHPAHYVQINNYTTFAYQTKISSNLPVLNLASGILEPFIYGGYQNLQYGNLLYESTMRETGVSSISGTTTHFVLAFNYTFDPANRIHNHNNYPIKHTTITTENLPLPDNNSNGMKVLPHQIDDNSQANISLIVNQLIPNDTDWGDDSIFKIEENGEYTNLNGDTCKSAIHKLAIPYGYINNKT